MFSANSSQVSADKLFIEDVFSTWLYTGTGAAQTITNGIDLAGKGGLVIQKERTAAYNDGWFWGDTVRGANTILKSQFANAQATIANSISAFSSTGFTAGSNIAFSESNYASWTFREAPKFFDVVTWTGNGVSGRQISHNLGSVPGMIIVKSTTRAENWTVYHQSLGNTGRIALNTTAAAVTGSGIWASTTPTATNFTVSADNLVNFSGDGYVAYLFAHDATADGLIQCGTFTTDPSTYGFNVTLGWEPQWVIIKRADGAGNWMLYDNMRGMPVGPSSGYSSELYPNTSGAESLGFLVAPNATGFSSPYYVAPSANFIYMAIRRGPMKTPTLGTSVFSPAAQAGGSSMTTNFPADLAISQVRDGSGSTSVFDRMRSVSTTRYAQLNISSTSGENNGTGYGVGLQSNTSVTDNWFGSGSNIAYWNFRRAPGFFDEVCYTGTAANRTISHNLGVVPELMIVKARNAGEEWFVYSASLLATEYVNLNNALAKTGGAATTWNSTRPTASVFSVGTSYNTNGPYNYVAYLFASCPGVSKVGSYTGNGSSQTINCGFAAGARFVMIKRTDSTGDWYVWDTARGIVAGNDPHLSLNTGSPEVTTDDTIDTASSGFVVNQVAATNVNVSSATYIYLAIA